MFFSVVELHFVVSTSASDCLARPS